MCTVKGALFKVRAIAIRRLSLSAGHGHSRSRKVIYFYSGTRVNQIMTIGPHLVSRLFSAMVAEVADHDRKKNSRKPIATQQQKVENENIDY